MSLIRKYYRVIPPSQFGPKSRNVDEGRGHTARTLLVPKPRAQRGSGISPCLSVVLPIEAVAGSPAEYASNIRAVSLTERVSRQRETLNDSTPWPMAQAVSRSTSSRFSRSLCRDSRGVVSFSSDPSKDLVVAYLVLWPKFDCSHRPRQRTHCGRS